MVQKWGVPQHLDPFKNIVDFDLEAKRRELAALEPVDGAWVASASLERFDLTQMPYKMLRRFEAKIDTFDMGYNPRFGPCWLWQGGLHPKGYGRFWLGEIKETGERIWAYAHRIAFEHWVGMPPRGYIVDHECNVKTCCNPAHLWPQTNEENLRLAYERNPWQHRNQYSQD